MKFTLSILILAAIAFLLRPTTALAIGCVAAKSDSPLIFPRDVHEETEHWQAQLNWRYQRSARHYVGDAEQVQRADDESEVINNAHTMDMGLAKDLDDRWTVSVDVPYLMATGLLAPILIFFSRQLLVSGISAGPFYNRAGMRAFRKPNIDQSC